MSVEFKDYSIKVEKIIEENVPATLHAIGIKALNLTLKQMQSGYGNPIRQTGDLMRDVNYEIDVSSKSVSIGNSLEYSLPVHEGTYKMQGRPYLRDGIMGGIDEIQKVAEAYMKKGFE